jgi:hypothetical protein
MIVFPFRGPVNSEPPGTKKTGAMRRHVTEPFPKARETANTGGASAPNGAGSAVDGTPRPAMVTVDRFGLTGARRQPDVIERQD